MRRRKNMSVTDKTFSEVFRNSLEVLAIVQELAARDHFISVEGLCKHHPEIIERYCSTAEAALRALERLKRKKPNS